MSLEPNNTKLSLFGASIFSSLCKMKILFPITLALAACDADASLRAAERRLSFEKIAEYEPLSKVTDHVSFHRCQRLKSGLTNVSVN
jgi:hypothetical protein